MSLNLSSILVPALISIIACAGTLIIVARTWLVPLLMEVIDTKLEHTDEMMKAGASAMGKASVNSRNEAKLEKLVIGDIMAEYPEIEMMLDYFSPETADMLREHPEKALKLLIRYKPLLETFMANKGEGQEALKPFDY